MDEPHDFLFYLSQVLGWIYFFAWSFSFYGQVIENYRRKSVSGLCFDFPVYNLTGFIGYSIYNIWGYMDHNIGTGKVEIQDIVFSVHAVLLTLVCIFQIFLYYEKDNPYQKVSNICKTITICLWWGVLQIIFIERILNLYDPHRDPKDIGFVFNSVVYLGWCKVFISLIKYIPQAISNWRRKSTEGWNIHNILLDMTGGLFSFLQNLIDGIRGDFSITNDSQPHSLNIAKYALSVISIFFDIIFLTQHYVLYRRKETIQNKYEALVNNL
jgi:cystinosin